MVFDRPTVTETLYPILFDIENDKLVEEHEVAEQFMGRAQVDGCYAPLEESMKLENSTIDDLRYDFKECIDEYTEAHRNEIQTRIENSKKLRFQQTIQYYDSREKSLNHSISEHEYNLEFALMRKDEDEQKRAEGALRLMRSNLRDLKERRENDIERINRDVHLKVYNDIKSLNLVLVK